MTERDLLKLAGKLAIICEKILSSDAYNLSSNIVKMEIALNAYNNSIMEFKNK